MVKTYPGTETIEDDIRATRRSIDDKVERIQQRLSPSDLVDSVIDFARTNGGAIAGSVGRGVRENPVPVALIGAGVVWLALASRARHEHDADAEDWSSSGESTGERLRHRAAAVREGVRERASEARERAGEIGHKARVQATRARRSSGRFVKDHPILVGAAGIALGAAIAASLPRTSREDDTFGERADRAKRAAKRAAVKEGRKVQEAAKSAVEKAREAAERKAPDAGDLKRDAESAVKAAGGAKSTPGATG
jgi:ElaB/YqjD/DUF883 family membrane-anchored ribosome-binding protein